NLAKFYGQSCSFKFSELCKDYRKSYGIEDICDAYIVKEFCQKNTSTIRWRKNGGKIVWKQKAKKVFRKNELALEQNGILVEKINSYFQGNMSSLTKFNNYTDQIRQSEQNQNILEHPSQK
ncbi:hypothetical protein ABPG73_010577, partial [Tetrahymena malaccensis]